jgi:hypothetical protein
MTNRIRRYSSVTLPLDMLQFIDEIAIRISDGNSADNEEISVPSRRKVVQDAVYILIKELYPDMEKDYLRMLEDSNSLEFSKEVKDLIKKKNARSIQRIINN